jgi:polygalacturonase
MKKIFGLLFATALSISCNCLHAQDSRNLPWVSKVGARSTPTGAKEFSVNKYGAKEDGKTLASPSIQKAIDACAAQGGGIVTFKPGTYLMGSIFLKSNVHLRIDKGVQIMGSQNFDDYPEIDTRIAGIEMKWPAALINAIGQKNVAVSGEGNINADGKFCWDKYWKMRKEYDPKGLRWVVDYDAKRVRTILIQNCEDVNLKGLTIANAGFWTVQILYSSYVTVDGLVIRNNQDGKGPSTDGVDIDSSTWILVENCDVDCNDDDFCLKAGRDWDGLRVNKPTEYVVIRDCIARKGGGLLTLGSETSGGIRHVLATNLKAHGTGNGFHIKSAFTRGGVVEDIYFENAQLDSVKKAFHFLMNWNPAYSYSELPKGYNADSVPEHWLKLLRKPDPIEKGIPTFKDIYINDVNITNAQIALFAEGMDKSMLENFHFNKVHIEANTAGSIDFAKNWSFADFNIITKDNSKVELKKVEAVTLP